jgi:hypothetical protein
MFTEEEVVAAPGMMIRVFLVRSTGPTSWLVLK